MPKYIIKLSDKEKNYYLEWSTIVDAPVSNGMALEEFKSYYKELYGTSSLEDLEKRLERVEQKGTSSLVDSLKETISNNRAGYREQHLTYKQLIENYCLKK